MYGHLNALEVATDWNEVKDDAEVRSLTTYSEPHEREHPAERHNICSRGTGTAMEQGSPAASITAKERSTIRKRLSGFFKKTTALGGAKLTSKSTISLVAPMVNSDNTGHCMGSDDAFSLLTSRSDFAPDRDEALEVDHDSPPMPRMPSQLAEPGTPELKRNHRNVHIFGTSPDHAVIMHNTQAYCSPDKCHYRQRAGTTKSNTTQSVHDHRATTLEIADKQPDNPFDVKLISEHINPSASDHDDVPSTPTRKRRSKTAKVAKKRWERRSPFRKGELAAAFDEGDSTTPPQRSFDALTYSGDEGSVHTAKAVRMTLRKASLVDIPARRGNKYPATINKDEPQNMALFSNPPDKDMLKVELEAHTKKAQEAQVIAGDAMTKGTDSLPTSLKTNCPLTNLKISLKAKDDERDDPNDQRAEQQEREKSDNAGGAVEEKEDTKGGNDGGGNGTARARMEGY